MSASEDQTVQRSIALPGLLSNQMSLATIVVLLGVSYMFNSMDRQVFPALLSTPVRGLGAPHESTVQRSPDPCRPGALLKPCVR
jgi:hypothetical protein